MSFRIGFKFKKPSDNSKKPQHPKGFARARVKTQVLEPIMTPSGFLDGSEETPDYGITDLEVPGLDAEPADDTGAEDLMESDSAIEPARLAAEESVADAPDATDTDEIPFAGSDAEDADATDESADIVALSAIETPIPDEELEEIPFVTSEDATDEIADAELDAADEPAVESISEVRLDETADEVDDAAIAASTAETADEVDDSETADPVEDTTLEVADDDAAIAASTAETADEVDNSETANPVEETVLEVADAEVVNPQPQLDTGVFVIDESGTVTIDFLFDGGGYKGEMVIFSLDGMDEFEFGSEEFIKEAASRGLSNTELGYVVISDASEGARFNAELGEPSQNSGSYMGVKTFAMRPGDSFGVMLVPNGTAQQVFDNPGIGGDVRPLFSMATANPNDAYHVGQIADVTGDGSTYVMEDLRTDEWTDRDYNDIVFQVRGATAKAPLMDDVVDPARDWRGTDMGQALIAYAQPYITPEEPVEEIEGTLDDLISELENLLEDADTSDEVSDTATAEVSTPAETQPTDIAETGETSAEVGDAAADTVATPAETLPADILEIGETSAEVGDAAADTVATPAETLPADILEIGETSAEIGDAAADTVATPAENPAVETAEPAQPADVAENPAVETAEPAQPADVAENPAVESAEPAQPADVAENPAVESAEPAQPADVAENPAVESAEPAQPAAEVTESAAAPAENSPAADSQTVAISDEATDAATETAPTANESAADSTATEPLEEGAETFNPESGETDAASVSIAQSESNVKEDVIFRLESLTQTLRIQATEAPAIAQTPVSIALIEKLETLTESLKNQSASKPVSASTLALISRVEEIVGRSLLHKIEQVAPVQYEFAKADQPLVGVIDTGFAANNPDINYSRITLGRDRVSGDDNPLLASGEGNEHGTYILGIIAATQNNGTGIDGINDDAPLWVGRAIGSGKWADSLVEFVDAAKESGQPNAVVNLSLDLTQIDANRNVTTRYEFTPEERAAIEYARQHNVLIVVAAGNDGAVMSALGQSSQEFDNIITVGAATRVNDEIALSKAYDRAEYSSYGNGLDIMAEGGTVENPELSTVGDGVSTMAGTSVATAKVTGAASLVWAANPGLSYRQVIEILKSTATDLKWANEDLETGAGLLNVAAAVSLAKATTPEVYDPEAFATPTTWNGAAKVTPGERAVGIEYGTYQPNVSAAFLNKVKTIGQNLGLAPEYLMAVMGFETGGTYSPSIRNSVSGATGLIQFMPSTAQSLGTSVNALAQMTAIQQLDYVEKYLRPYKGRFSTLEDAYMAVLWPAAVGKGSNYILFRTGTIQYAQNSGLDLNRDGVVTAREATNKVRQYLPPASLFGSSADNSSPPSFTGKVRNSGYVQQVGFLRVRSGPGTTGYSEVSRLYPGNVRQFSGETQGQWVADPNMPGGGSSTWYRLADGSGWVSGQYIEKVSLDQRVGYDGTSTHQTYINTFNRNGGQAALGSPTNNVHPWENGYTQDFSGGTEGKGAIMKSNANDNSYWVGSDFWNKFLELNGARGILQYPTSDRFSTNGGWRQNFQGGAIIKSSKGIFPLYGGIGAHYLNSEGGEKGRLGFPTSGEVGVGNGVIHQHFENGYIRYGDGPTRTVMTVQTPASVTIGGYTVSGNFYPVFQKYQLGNPISGVINHSSGATYQLFQKGSIVSSQYGTFPLYGGIRQTYLNHGGLNGWLGAPKSAEYGLGNGVIRQDFANGYIIWNGSKATAYQYGSGTSNQPKPPTQPNPGSNPNPGNGQRIIDAVNKVNPDQWYYRRRDITGDGKVETFCNWFAADVLEYLGVPIPRQINSPYKMNPPVFGGANRDKPISAEQLYTFFNNGGGGKWQKVSAADAAAKANNGQAVVASSYGHIAIVIPGSSASNVRIAQAGWNNGKNMAVKDGFGNVPFSYFAYVG